MAARLLSHQQHSPQLGARSSATTVAQSPTYKSIPGAGVKDFSSTSTPSSNSGSPPPMNPLSPTPNKRATATASTPTHNALNNTSNNNIYSNHTSHSTGNASTPSHNNHVNHSDSTSSNNGSFTPSSPGGNPTPLAGRNKGKLNKLLGLQDSDHAQVKVQVDKNADLRKQIINSGYRVPTLSEDDIKRFARHYAAPLALESSMEELHILDCYEKHSCMADAFAARFSVGEAGQLIEKESRSPPTPIGGRSNGLVSGEHLLPPSRRDSEDSKREHSSQLTSRLKKFSNFNLSINAMNTNHNNSVSASSVSPPSVTSAFPSSPTTTSTIINAAAVATAGAAFSSAAAFSPSILSSLMQDEDRRLHLRVDVKQVMISVGEPVEVYFSLYSSLRKEFITEEYAISLTASGWPEGGMNVKCCALFESIDLNDERNGGLKLICKIYRSGELVKREQSSKDIKKRTGGYQQQEIQKFRRPWAQAVLDLNGPYLDALVSVNGKELDCPNPQIYVPVVEKDFQDLQDLIIAQSKDIEVAKSSMGVAYGISAFYCTNSHLNHLYASAIAGATRVPRLSSFTTNSCIANPKLRVNNFLYITLLSGEFQQGLKKTAKNILVRVQVRENKALYPLPNCLCRGHGEMLKPVSEFYSTVYYHFNSPQWNERICFNIPSHVTNLFSGQTEPFDAANFHLFFEFCHVSSSTGKKGEEPFSFCFLPLTELSKSSSASTTSTMAFLRDGIYRPPLYKYSKHEEKNRTYQTYSKEFAAERQTKEKFQFQCSLVATNISQDVDLQRVLAWDRTDSEALTAALIALPRKSPLDYPYLMVSVLDALFSMMTSNQYGATENQVHRLAQTGMLHILTALNLDSAANGVMQPPEQQQTAAQPTVSMLSPRQLLAAAGFSPVQSSSQLSFTSSNTLAPTAALRLCHTFLGQYMHSFFEQPRLHLVFINFFRTMLRWPLSENASRIREENAIGEKQYQALLYFISSIKLVLFIIFSSYQQQLQLLERFGEAKKSEARATFLQAFSLLMSDMNSVMAAEQPVWIINFKSKLIENFDQIFEAIQQMNLFPIVAAVIVEEKNSKPSNSPPGSPTPMSPIGAAMANATAQTSPTGMLAVPAAAASVVPSLVDLLCNFLASISTRNYEINIKKLRWIRMCLYPFLNDPDYKYPLLNVLLASELPKHIDSSTINERMHAIRILQELLPTLHMFVSTSASSKDGKESSSLSKITEEEEDLPGGLRLSIDKKPRGLSKDEKAMRREVKEAKKKERKQRDTLLNALALLIIPLFDNLNEYLNWKYETNNYYEKGIALLQGSQKDKDPIRETFVTILAIAQSKDDMLLGAEKFDYLLASVNQVKIAQQHRKYTPASPPSPVQSSPSSPTATPSSSTSAFAPKRHDREFLLTAYTCLTRLVHSSCFNKYWILFRCREISFSLRFLEWTCSYLVRSFLHSSLFDVNVWRAFYLLCGTLLLTDELNFESTTRVPEVDKRVFLSEKFSETKKMIAAQMQNVWVLLGPKQIELSDVLISPLIELTQNSENQIATLSRQMYFNLLSREFEVKASFQRIQYHTIETVAKIVHLFGKNKIPRSTLDDYIAFFTIHMKKLTAGNEKLNAAFQIFVDEIEDLFGHIIEVEQLPQTKKYEDERTQACINLITYLKQSGRMDLFEKYLVYLCELHSEQKNWLELGMTLLMHADLYDFQRKKVQLGQLVTDFGEYPAQREGERKILLHLKAMTAFDQAKNWEGSIKICQKLCAAFENTLYDFPALVQMLERQAKYFDSIMRDERIFFPYYRVAFFGRGFDALPSVKGKEFVFRSGDGGQLEGVKEFTDRIREKFPEAIVLNTSDLPSERVLRGEESGQFIQITTVQPSSEEELMGKKNRWEELGGPSRVSRYHQHHDVNIFSYQRVLKREGGREHKDSIKGSSNEFRDLWAVKVFLITNIALPSVQRRAEVVERKEIILSPSENAKLKLAAKNQEIRELLEKYIPAFAASSAALNGLDTSFGSGPALTIPLSPTNTTNVSIPASALNLGSAPSYTAGDLNPLTMLLQGTIDAAVQGGVEKYREAFFDGSYEKLYPDQKIHLDGFKKELADQFALLKSGLEIFGQRCEKAMKPLYEHLMKMYEKVCDGWKYILAS